MISKCHHTNIYEIDMCMLKNIYPFSQHRLQYKLPSNCETSLTVHSFEQSVHVTHLG